MRREIGFTLIELMIVVAVVAILALIALPMYSEQMRKGKRAEAAQALGDMQLRQESWRADHPTYGVLNDLTGSAAASTAFNNGLKYYTVSVAGNTATAYTLTATRKGVMTSDPKCGNFTMTMTAGVMTKGISTGDADYCWRK